MGNPDDAGERRRIGRSLEVPSRNVKSLDSRRAGSRRFISEEKRRMLDIWNFLSTDAWVPRA